MTNVALVKGNDRKEITSRALELIKDDIDKTIKKKKRIIIKPTLYPREHNSQQRMSIV